MRPGPCPFHPSQKTLSITTYLCTWVVVSLIPTLLHACFGELFNSNFLNQWKCYSTSKMGIAKAT
jgi:hypothetical protein